MKTRAFILPFAAALALYLSTLAPSLSWANHGADGGDLVVASALNGVPHPPGYPTYVTLGQLFARLPLGSMAYRFNLLSALCMALAVGLTSYTIAQTSPSRSIFAPIVASLFFATAPMVWGQAIIAEVYALNALFVALIIILLAKESAGQAGIPCVVAQKHLNQVSFRGALPSDEESRRIQQATPTTRDASSFLHGMTPLTLAALLWGLALGNSVTIAALIPLMFIAWWRAVARERLLSIVAFLLGLSIYALIPLRAALNLPINWGHAVTWPEFAAQVSAEMYRGYMFAVPLNSYPARLVALAQLAVQQFGWLGISLGALGTWHIIRRSNRDWPWFALSALLYIAFAVTYNTIDSDLYLIPVWLFATWPVAYGLWRVIEWVDLRVRFNLHLAFFILLSILFLGPGLNVVTNYARLNLRQDHAAGTFARTILAQTPAGAILITRDDAQTFTLWYYRFLEGQRPDVAIVDARMAGYPWYEPMLAAQGHALRLPEYDPTETWLKRFRALNAGRSVCEIEEVAIARCD